jgi:hypothetical protein
MVFITHCWKNAPIEAGAKRSRLRGLLHIALLLAALCAALPVARAAAAANAAIAQLTQLRTQSAEDGIYLSANVDFELPNVVEDALLKGIPLFFVIEVEILRDRWYWTDQRVAAASRTIRLAYQPLTRRWRVNIGSGLVGSASSLRFSFKLDLSQLPRPFQIGVAGQRDWTIAIESTQKMTLQAARPAELVKDSPAGEGLK